jgi:hypothetical protein
MSKEFPECPRYSHNNCREYKNSKVCALSRADKICLKPKGKEKVNKRFLTKEQYSPVEHQLSTHYFNARYRSY